jgi:hypothetical protein
MVRLPCAKAEAESRARHPARMALAAFAFEKTVDKNHCCPLKVVDEVKS